MATKNELIDSLTDKCEIEFKYGEIVNDFIREIDFRPIVEFIVDTILGVWKGEDNAD